MQQAFFTKDNLHEYNKLISQHDGYCQNCGKPERRLYCSKCEYHLFNTGLEPRRVNFKEVGISTINYQQQLHRNFFGCNAPIEYRGIKENRHRFKIKEETIEKAVKRLDRLLKTHTVKYNGKTNKKRVKHFEIYKLIREHKNVTRRLLYNLVLYYLSYFSENHKGFRTTMHFQASMLSNLFMTIANIHLRINKGDIRYLHKERRKYNRTIYYNLLDTIESIVNPIIYELVLTKK